MNVIERLVRKKALLHLLWAVPLAGLLILVAIDWRVSAAAEGRVYDKIEDVPERPVALVLGAARHLDDGRLNLFYTQRIRAAAELFEAGKVRGILVSGDNSRKDYDEPTDMKEDLVRLGVPEEYITTDYAGFRTLDSIVRAKEVFGQDSVTVVSQTFHCRRAVYLAKAKGLDAVGYVAGDVGGAPGMKVRLRETLARAKAFLDLHVLRTGPKYLGEKETALLRDR